MGRGVWVFWAGAQEVVLSHSFIGAESHHLGEGLCGVWGGQFPTRPCTRVTHTHTDTCHTCHTPPATAPAQGTIESLQLRRWALPRTPHYCLKNPCWSLGELRAAPGARGEQEPPPRRSHSTHGSAPSTGTWRHLGAGRGDKEGLGASSSSCRVLPAVPRPLLAIAGPPERGLGHPQWPPEPGRRGGAEGGAQGGPSGGPLTRAMAASSLQNSSSTTTPLNSTV